MNHVFDFPDNITVGLLMFERESMKYKIVPALPYQQEIYNIWVLHGKESMDQSHALFRTVVSKLSEESGTPVKFNIGPRPTQSICDYYTESAVYWMSNDPNELYTFRGYATRLTCII